LKNENHEATHCEHKFRRQRSFYMSDTTVIAAAPLERPHTPFSWSAAIAGAFAATAVAFIIAALGTGIGLPFTSPYKSGLSATGLTVAAAVWLVMAQAIGFATGGYLAGRLRSPAYDGVIGERTFRDAAQGFMVWAIGVVAMASIAGGLGLYAASTAAQVAAGLAANAIPSSRDQSTTASNTITDYYVDALLRPAPNAAATAGGQPATVGVAAAGAQPAGTAEARAEVARIISHSIQQGRLDDTDRAYLAQLVATRTGVAPDEAQRRVTESETKAREAVKDATDKAAKTGAYLAFWTFMALLFGAVAATLAGMIGGQLRDAEGRLA
jgi:hypothetical protein